MDRVLGAGDLREAFRVLKVPKSRREVVAERLRMWSRRVQYSGDGNSLEVQIGGEHERLLELRWLVSRLRIVKLDLHGSQLTSFSSEGLGNLTKLYLSSNQLTSFSSEGWENLTELYLSGNQLTSFSSEGWENLTELYLHDNQLTSFSSEGLGNLTVLDLSGNQLTSFSFGKGWGI